MPTKHKTKRRKYILIGRMSPHTFKYRVRKQPGKSITGKEQPWGDIEFMSDDGVWRSIRRYKKLDNAYEVLIRHLGFGSILEKNF